ncbi:hypothetical protein LTS17_001819 [Exophiala oligosperma]
MVHLPSNLLRVILVAAAATATPVHQAPSTGSSAENHALSVFPRAGSTAIGQPEGGWAQSCTTLKKKTAGKAWNLYYAGHGQLRFDSMVPLRASLGTDPSDVCAVANDIERSCTAFATSYGLQQATIIWKEPGDPFDRGDTPWFCRLSLDNNSDPSLFGADPDGFSDHVWAWTQS